MTRGDGGAEGSRNPLVWILLAATVVGIIVATLSLITHYEKGTSFCTVNEKFDCDVVNKGPYSEIFGIPIALFGLLSYIAYFFVVLRERCLRRVTGLRAGEFWRYAAGFATLMFAFSLSLTSLEFFVIHSWCILCLLSQAVTALLLLTWFLVEKNAG